jgi:hypothetical protein
MKLLFNINITMDFMKVKKVKKKVEEE